MKLYSTFIALVAGFFLLSFTSNAQQQWPKLATGSDGTVIKLYQLQPESYSNNSLKGRAAISIVDDSKSDPVFGVIWFTAATEQDGDRVQVTSMEITSIKLPGDINDDKLGSIQEALGVTLNYSGNNGIYYAFQNTGDFIYPNFRLDLEYLLDQDVRVSLAYGDADYICKISQEPRSSGSLLTMHSRQLVRWPSHQSCSRLYPQQRIQRRRVRGHGRRRHRIR